MSENTPASPHPQGMPSSDTASPTTATPDAAPELFAPSAAPVASSTAAPVPSSTAAPVAPGAAPVPPSTGAPVAPGAAPVPPPVAPVPPMPAPLAPYTPPAAPVSPAFGGPDHGAARLPAGAPRVPDQPGHSAHPAQPVYPAQPGAVPPFGGLGDPVPADRPAPGFGSTQPTLPYPALPETAVQEGFGQPGPVPPAPTREKVGAGRVVAIMVAAAVVGGAAGLGGAAVGSAVLGSPGSTVVQSGPTTVTVNDAEDVNRTTGIATKVLPSVVTISATSASAGGTGSGVVLTADGYVATNTHVVTLDGATADAGLSVTTSDGQVFAATIVGTDPIYDLAVIKLTDAEGLTPIEFADSSELNVGDGTVAVGAPLGLSNTVTTGIVSALNRSIQIASSAAPDSGDTQQDDGSGSEGPFQFDFGQGQQPTGSSGSISIAVIQTDAAINPGNSGGALVDTDGKLIGINVAIATAGSSSSEAAGSIGVGFSIPSNIVQRVTDEILADGSASHGLLGAMVGNAAAQQGATTTGAYISEVTPEGAAATAGLEAGDVVTQFNGVPVADATDLTAQVRALAGGAKADVVYLRDGKAESVQVTLGELQG